MQTNYISWHDPMYSRGMRELGSCANIPHPSRIGGGARGTAAPGRGSIFTLSRHTNDAVAKLNSDPQTCPQLRAPARSRDTL
jgi:hypothetical protein